MIICCRDIFLWIIILCKEFSGIDIFKLEYLTKSLNPKKWWQRISEDQHMKKVERFIVCCSSHCTFTSFVNCLVRQVLAFIFMPIGEIYFKIPLICAEQKLNHKKVKFLYLLFVSSFFSNCYAYVQGYEGRRQMAVCKDAWQRKDSTIKHPRSVKIPANQFVWFSVIYQLCVCNIFIRFVLRFVPVRIRFHF